MDKVTATLENWTQIGQVIYGQIYGDTRGRFVDGQQVRTSRLDEIVHDDDMVKYAYTQNSVYKLGVPNG